MRIVLVHPVGLMPGIQYYQLGLMSISAQLKETGYEVSLLPVAELQRIDADVLCIYTIDCLVDFTSELIEMNRHCKIILGGPAATITPEYITSQLYYDVLCRGEGEAALLEYFESGSKDILSLWFDCGAIRNEIRPQIQDTTNLLPPDPWGLDTVQSLYRQMFHLDITHVIASRGCPFSCTYCSNSGYNRILKHGVRYRTPEQMIEEIGEVNIVVFEDDILNADKEWFKRMCHLLKEQRYTFEMNTRVNCITETEVKMAKEAGCSCIRFGVESGTSQIRQRMGRDTMTNEDILQLANWVASQGIDVYINTIIGVPPETPTLFNETHNLVKTIYEMCQKRKVKCTVILNTYYPLRGTPLGDETIETAGYNQGISAHVDYSLQSENMSAEYVRTMQQYFRDNYTGMIPMWEGDHGNR